MNCSSEPVNTTYYPNQQQVAFGQMILAAEVQKIKSSSSSDSSHAFHRAEELWQPRPDPWNIAVFLLSWLDHGNFDKVHDYGPLQSIPRPVIDHELAAISKVCEVFRKKIRFLFNFEEQIFWTIWCLFAELTLLKQNAINKFFSNKCSSQMLVRSEQLEFRPQKAQKVRRNSLMLP